MVIPPLFQGRGSPMGALSRREYLALAYEQAMRSKDPSTQQGAIIVSQKGCVIGQGYNRFGAGLLESPARLVDRSRKYPRMVHAEAAAIWDAVRCGHVGLLKTSTMYCPWFACAPCALMILESGIRAVVGHRDHPGFRDPHGDWAELVAIGLGMLDEAGVVCDYVEGPVSGPRSGLEIRVDKQPFRP